MTRKPISAADATPVRVVIVTLDSHLASACARAEARLRRDWPGLTLTLHAAAEWGETPDALNRCRADIASADILIATMLFMEEQIDPVIDALKARRETCDAMVCAMSAPEVAKLTRMGRFKPGEGGGGALSFLKKLKPKSGPGQDASAGQRQMAMLRRLPKILRFIPGPAQDVRAYFLALQYWLAGSDENMVNMVRMLVDRYASGPRAALKGQIRAADPIEYPEVGVYHPRLPGRIAESPDMLPRKPRSAGTVGVIMLRSYLLAGNSAHYDGVIAALEAKGLDVVPAFAAGLDARPAIERFFMANGRATVDAVVSLTGFSLVGGPAYNDAAAAQDMLAALDVPYLAAMPVEFQTLEEWGGSARGLMPVEATIMVSIPELDGATGPTVFGGRGGGSGEACHGCGRLCTFEGEAGARNVHSCTERAEALAARVSRLIALRKKARAERKLAITLFNFPPNAGNIGTAAYLSVFESLHRVLAELKFQGYVVDAPATPDALREAILSGNAALYGANANVYVRIPAAEHVRRERWLSEIEAQWGPAPGRQQSDGASIHVLGAQFGNVFVGVQPAFGYEGDPMRLLFERGFSPTHAFSAFYRWIREDFRADAVVHFGTHGALEFMPGKQTGLGEACWPDRLIGDLPNVYLYAANNPSEGAIAKRRAAATLVSYLTPPVAQAGLYRGLADLKGSIDRWRALTPEQNGERADLAALIQAQAAKVELAPAEPMWDCPERSIAGLIDKVLEVEYALIPHGLHVFGAVPSQAERADLVQALADAHHGVKLDKADAEAFVAGQPAAGLAQLSTEAKAQLFGLLAALERDGEMEGLIRALDARYIRPAPGGDLIRNAAILPTGRNIHGFDPFRLPSAFAVADGARQAERLLERHMADGNPLPESIALVLWGTDNLKNEGGPISQALALMGARPRHDAYGRLAGAALVPLGELGRPRIDVVMTLSGIFRDLLPLQIKLLAEAAFLAASADEPLTENYVRKHALAYMDKHGCDLETAALRVFSNADGAYGSNVNNLVTSSTFGDDDELAEAYQRRKCFAYGRKGRPQQQGELMRSMLADVSLTYQNLDSVELGVTTLDQYFDTLGGVSRAVKRARNGQEAPVYISDQTASAGAVRTLSEQVALEARTRVLNPKWYEGMLRHGYEGVRQIEEHVTNTVGWSATTGQVQPWVYQQITELYVLDPAMRERLAALNSTASARLANRLIEAHQRNYWKPDQATLDALQAAGEALEDRLEGVIAGAPVAGARPVA
jgi:magnesium chelatase subunit H